MSQIKRKLEKRQKHKFDPIFLEEIQNYIDYLKDIKAVKSCQIYKELRKEFVDRGFKPFQIMAYYQTSNILNKNGDISQELAFEQGIKIAASIAQKRRR